MQAVNPMLFAPFLVLCVPLLLLEWRISPPSVPAFHVRNMQDESLSSLVHERQEANQLSAHIRHGDRVWNLGVDIGTSCITIARLSGNLNETVCVEPNTVILPKTRDAWLKKSATCGQSSHGAARIVMKCSIAFLRRTWPEMASEMPIC